MSAEDSKRPPSWSLALEELARLYGVETGYRSTAGRWQTSSPAAVAQVLDALRAGETGTSLAEALSPGGTEAQCRRILEHAIDARRAELTDLLIEPVLVAWNGAPPPVRAAVEIAQGRRPSSGGTVTDLRRVSMSLLLESGEEERWEMGWDQFWTGRGAASGWWRRARLPFGYHRLRVEAGDRVAEAVVISAPLRCWSGESEENGRPSLSSGDVSADGRAGAFAALPKWGVFAPLYSLRSNRDWGAGDLAELGELQRQVAGAGGSAVATLPLLAGYLDQPFEPGPYRPVSRLFWNESYLAVDRIPEWDACEPVRREWASGGIGERVARLRAEPLVDHAGVAAVKRAALEGLCRCFFERADGKRRQEFAVFAGSDPDILQYAAFRARVDVLGKDWRTWSRDDINTLADITARPLEPADLGEAGRYHLYCQWQMEEQLSGLAGADGGRVGGGTEAKSTSPPGLFLDLPVGVHPGGFDTWRWRDAFVGEMFGGAPPDGFFTLGQDWQTPPLHPQRARQQGHQYFARCLQHHMRFARYLRIDHVMSLHRLFWVPEGRDPVEGVYVRYPADELYAVLCLESHRHRTIVVGEDLGTVPAGVRAALRRHGVLGTWVMQSALKPRAPRVLDAVGGHAVAALGTHDMFPLLGFLRGHDIDARVETGQLDAQRADRVTAARRRLVMRLAAFLTGEGMDPSEMGRSGDHAGIGGGLQTDSERARFLHGALAYLAASPAALSLVNLDDLLFETKPQNLPGTGEERDNWRRKAAGTLEVAGPAITAAGRVFATAAGGRSSTAGT